LPSLSREQRGKPEARTLPRRAFYADAAAHALDQWSADGQPKPGSSVFARHRIVGLHERLEQLRLGLRRYAYTGILDFKTQQHIGCRFLLRRHAGCHRAGVGKFDGVADEVGQDLAQATRVATQQGGMSVVSMKLTYQIS
jgi:hypothetical protein